MATTLPLIAGILSPGLLTVGLFIWQDRWKKDALSLNAFKCAFASIFFGVLVASFSQHSNAEYSVQVVGYMMLSSALGIIIADTWWLIALERIGARRMITIDAVKPFLALAFGSFVLKDSVGTMAIVGIILTSLGILLVNLEKREEVGSNKTNDTSLIDVGNKTLLKNDGISIVSSPEITNQLHQNNPKQEAMQQKQFVKNLRDHGLDQFIDEFATFEIISSSDVISVSKQASISTEHQQMLLDALGNVSSDGIPISNDERSIELTMMTLSSDDHLESANLSLEVENKKSSELITTNNEKGIDVVAYLYALGNVVLDVYAATLIVKWHGSLSSADVNLIRFGFAGVVLVFTIGVKRQKLRSLNFIFKEDPLAYTSTMTTSDWLAVSGGIVFVTVLTPLINTWVLFKLPLAIAITLNSTSPLWSLPVAYVHREVISAKAILGAVLATGGIVLLVTG